MIFIGGISQGKKYLSGDFVKTVICGRCGHYGRYQVFMTYLYFSFFFIPLFKWGYHYYVEMSCCGTVYELNPEVGRTLAHGGRADITEADLTLVRGGSAVKRCPRCGYQTGEDFEFCPKCGERLE